MKNSVSFKDLNQAINDFREENNRRFDKIETMFISFHKEEFIPLEKRITTLEKMADRALFFILLISGVFAAVWQIVVGWIKRELKI